MPRKRLQGRTCGVSRDGERARASRDGWCAWLQARAQGLIPWRVPKAVGHRAPVQAAHASALPAHGERARCVERSNARIG
ncbi:hypothetical protein XarbCFBP8150_06815 [Xanthomonas arboricola]|nr:hypothetical protein XarbCFBP8150_06815 [Xanthomonas arboricola]